MPCAIPIRIINPHYRKIADELNDDVYQYEDRQDFYLDVPCGQCINCLKSRGNSWSLRLQLEYKYLTHQQKNNSFFVTMTLSDEYINEDKSLLIRRFLERIRKKIGHSIRHWFINEYGDTTGRFHYHGIIFDLPFSRSEFLSYWKYGHIVIKKLTPKRIGYVTTYVTKHLKKSPFQFTDVKLLQDPDKKQKIWCSPGLGKKVVEDKTITSHLRIDSSCTPVMFNTSGRITAIPRYLRKKFFTEEELENLQQTYYANLSEDVIPPPPYRIGNKNYIDYTIYLSDCEKLRKQRISQNCKYNGKSIAQSYFQTLGFRLSPSEESKLE